MPPPVTCQTPVVGSLTTVDRANADGSADGADADGGAKATGCSEETGVVWAGAAEEIGAGLTGDAEEAGAVGPAGISSWAALSAEHTRVSSVGGLLVAISSRMLT